MAIKVALAAALLVALVALAGATTYTTTVTTTSIDDEANPGRECSRQLQGRQFRACQRYLTQGRRGPYEEEEDVLEMTTRNQGRQQQDEQECCRSLREVDQQQQCGCEAIREAVRQVQQRGGQQTGQSQQVYQQAQDLPRVCNLRSQRCQFHVVFL